MGNLDIYNAMRTTPQEAKKSIQAGRLKGFTDIRPMYRIKKLTEVFGLCGFGWKYEITSQRIETAPNGEAKAFVDINLYVKQNGEWSDPIPGIGGNSFVSNEKSGVYVNDECFKSALSDAIGTACKNLGMCADVYWAEDRTKYDAPAAPSREKKAETGKLLICEECGSPIKGYTTPGGTDVSAEQAAATATKHFGKALCASCMRKAAADAK